MLRPAAPRDVTWPLLVHRGPVARVSVSPDGKVLASGGEDGHVRLANLQLGHPSFDVDVGAEVADLDAGSSFVAVAVGAAVALIGVHAGVEVRRLAAPGRVRAVALSPDGSQVVAACEGGAVVAWRLATGREVGRSTVAGASAVAFAGRGALRVGTDAGEVLALDPRGGAPPEVRARGEAPIARVVAVADERRGSLLTLALGADGRCLVADGEADVPVPAADVAVGEGVLLALGPAGWGLAGGAVVPAPAVSRVAWHPSGTHVALATAEGEVGVVALPR